MESLHANLASVSPPAVKPLEPIPPYRVAQFARGVAARVRKALAVGEREQDVYDAIQDERLALAAALDSAPMRACFAQAYQQHYSALVPSLAPSLAACREYTDEVLDHRINDARTLSALVYSPTFLAMVQTELAAPEQEKPYALPPEKIDEMVERFAEDTAPRGSDAKIHARQAMDGHRLGHLALAECYKANGPLQPVLQQQLAPYFPMHPMVPAQLSLDWLEARRKPALATVTSLAEDGIVTQQVMQRIAVSASKNSFTARVSAEKNAAVPVIGGM